MTTFLGVGIMSTFAPLPMDRVHLLNPGEAITVGDRTLTAYKPPVFDNPSTTRASAMTSPAPCSARTAFGALLKQFLSELMISRTMSCGRARSFGRRSTRRGFTRSTPPSSRKS